MSEAPERHPDIPAEAVWSPESERWEVGARDAAGAREGEHRRYRADGSLHQHWQYRAGLEEGPFLEYHPNGQLAREGRFVAGAPDGPVVAYASDREDGEPLRSCCVPPGAWELRTLYEHGQPNASQFLDRQGRALLSDGRLCPVRPPALPDRAEYDEYEGRWSVPPGPGKDLWRTHAQDGRLLEEALFAEGRKTLTRLFAADGTVKQETALASDKPHGPHRRRFVDGEVSPYSDGRIVEERGAFEAGHPVGPWSFLDAGGAVVRAALRGPALGRDERQRPPFTAEPRSAEELGALADGLMAEGHTRPAVCAAARALGRSGDVATFAAFLARHTVALTPAAAAALAETAPGSDDAFADLLSALVGGGEAATLLRALAAAFVGPPRVGLDLADAAVHLAPERRMAYLTRALLRIEVGDERGALADADRVAPEAAETAQFLRDYARLVFPEWGFVPARERLPDDAAFDGLPEAPAQPLEAIRRLVQVYATRLGRLRERALAWTGSPAPAWLPPALPALLPGGPLALERTTATITDQTDEGTETVEVQIDETVADEAGALPAIMRAARAQWAALTWLCWSAGEEGVALPTRLAPPPGFAAAAGTAIGRFFRVQDAIATNGLRSLNAGVPGFTWEGLDIDTAPSHFVQLALEEYFELRALFLWLMSPENLSPFQSDLRQISIRTSA